MDHRTSNVKSNLIIFGEQHYLPRDVYFSFCAPKLGGTVFNFGKIWRKVSGFQFIYNYTNPILENSERMKIKYNLLSNYILTEKAIT